MKKTYLLGILFVVSLAITTNAQEQKEEPKKELTPGPGYKNQIGLRLGLTYGVSFKHCINDRNAIEAMLLNNVDESFLVGLYEWNRHAFGNQNWNCFYGIGGHIGTPRKGIDYTPWGVDLIGGLEYKFPAAPITLGADIKPYFNGFSLYYQGIYILSLRAHYAF